MLIQGTSSTIIIKFAAKHGLDINKYNISTHNRKHRAISQDDMKTEPSEKEAKKRVNANMKLVADPILILNMYVNQVYEGLSTGELKPSLSEGLKAIELIKKFETGSSIENLIMQFIQNVHLGNNN